MSDNSVLQQEIRELRDAINKVLYKEKDESNSPLKQFYEQIDSQYNSLKKDKENLEVEKKTLNEKLSIKEGELSDKEEELAQANRTISGKDGEIGELKKDKENLEVEKKTLNEKLSIKEGELSDKEEELVNLQNEIYIQVYEQYKKLPSDFRNNFGFIKEKSLFAFIATAGTSSAISKLHNVIKTNLTNNKSCDDLIDLFNALLEIQMTYQEDFERLTPKEGECFETSEHIRIGNGPSSGRVEKVILRGYKEGNTTYQSLVEVGVG